MSTAIEIALDVVNPALGALKCIRAFQKGNEEAGLAWAFYTITYIVFAINYKNF